MREGNPYSSVLVRRVTASANGQFSIPAEMMRALGAKGPMELLLVQDGDRIVLVPAARARQPVDDLEDWSALSLPAFAKLWDNDADEAWNDA
jgi:bifunctional DNA-binding transcriptional regulator/antitoxin component of YhaV-PrlF toxin-antitoxin module